MMMKIFGKKYQSKQTALFERQVCQMDVISYSRPERTFLRFSHFVLRDTASFALFINPFDSYSTLSDSLQLSSPADVTFSSSSFILSLSSLRFFYTSACWLFHSSIFLLSLLISSSFSAIFSFRAMMTSLSLLRTTSSYLACRIFSNSLLLYTFLSQPRLILIICDLAPHSCYWTCSVSTGFFIAFLCVETEWAYG